VRCRYELKGLSVVGLCPECGTPIVATILAVVDPHAEALKPVAHPRFLAGAIFGLAGCSLAASILTWLMRLADAGTQMFGIRFDDGALPFVGTACIIAAGLSATSLVRPHAQIGRGGVIRAALGVVAFAPLAVFYWLIHGVFDQAHAAPYIAPGESDAMRAVLRLGMGAFLLVAILGLRPNARVLARRAVVFRTGRADRQTMRAMAIAVGTWMVGDVLSLVGAHLGGLGAQVVRGSGVFLIVVGSVLFTIGLGGIVVDAWRLGRALIQPAVSLDRLLGTGRGSDP